MKLYLFLLALLTTSSCQQVTGPMRTPANEVVAPQPHNPIVPISTPSPEVAPTPISAPPEKVVSRLEVTIRKANDFDSEGLALLAKARELLERVVNSEEFKEKVLNFTYQGQKAYVQNDGLTNAQIYERIMAGAEQYPAATKPNSTMDLYVELYTSSWFGRNTIGYTSPDTSYVFMNTYFFNYATASGVAGNMIHEWLHKIGFDHDSNATARRPYTVPYAIGEIAEAMVEKLE